MDLTCRGELRLARFVNLRAPYRLRFYAEILSASLRILAAVITRCPQASMLTKDASTWPAHHMFFWRFCSMQHGRNNFKEVPCP